MGRRGALRRKLCQRHLARACVVRFPCRRHRRRRPWRHHAGADGRARHRKPARGRRDADRAGRRLRVRRRRDGEVWLIRPPSCPGMTNERFDRPSPPRYDNPHRCGLSTAMRIVKNVLQHLWPPVSGDDLRREPRGCDRLRGRWLPAAAAARGRGHPARSRPAPARTVAFYHPAAGSRCGKDSVRRDGASGDRRAGDDRHADRVVDRETDQRSKDYSDIKDKFRPGHADYTYEAKYGLRDYRGGGRSSARETATRVAAGAIARKILPGVTVRGALVQMGPHRIDRDKWDFDEIAKNPFFCPDRDKAAFFEGYLDDIRKKGSSIGAVIEVIAEGVPAGWGAPIYSKLDADLAAALMSINAVKGVEIGAGFGAAELSGEENADEMRMGNQGVSFLSNHAGGILGGISTGQPVVARFAVKPTSSILSPRRTVDRKGADTDIMTKGRHDPCVGIRAVPVGEAMMACVLADHFLRHRGQVG